MPTNAIDELIDAGKEREVYKLFSCKKPTHDPENGERDCRKCEMLTTERFSYPHCVHKCAEGGAHEIIDTDYVTWEKTEFRCGVKVYISARKKLEKGLEKICPSTI